MSDLTPETLNADLRDALIRKLTALGDDEVILSHRNGEWIGHAPILEEDIALANIAQDELGHGQSWYAVREGLDGMNPDALAYGRPADAFLSAQLVELPRGDWAFTLLRQFLFDAYEAVWMNAAQRSTYVPLREVAAKALREEKFHLQHTRIWVERLGLGTDESNRRTQAALDVLWPLTGQLFAPLPGEDALVQAGVVPDLRSLEGQWLDLVSAHLKASGLTLPDRPQRDWSRESHTEHLAAMLREMQEVNRADPEAVSW